jgi:outer membrane protein
MKLYSSNLRPADNALMRFIALFAFVFVFLAVSTAADETTSPLYLSLTDALRMAKQQNVEVLVANERVQQTLSRLSQARSVLWPQISANVSQTRQTRNLEANGITLPGRDPVVGPFNTFDGRLKLTQSLFDLSAIQRFSAAKASSRVSRAELNKVQQDAMALIASIYMEAKRASETAELSKILLNQSQEHRRLTKSQLEVGVGSIVDLTQAESEIANYSHQLQIARAEAIERKLDLISALGLTPHQQVVFTDTSAPKFLSTQEDLTNHPALVVEKERLQQRRAERNSEQAEYFPKLSGIADYGASGNEPSNSEKTYTFGVQVSLPLLEGGLRAARINEAESRLRETEARLNDTKNRIESKNVSAHHAVDSAIDLLKTSEAAFVLAEKQLSLAKQRFENGLGSQLELTDASAQASIVLDRKRQAVENLQLSKVNLAHAMGIIDQIVEKPQP